MVRLLACLLLMLLLALVACTQPREHPEIPEAPPPVTTPAPEPPPPAVEPVPEAVWPEPLPVPVTPVVAPPVAPPMRKGKTPPPVREQPEQVIQDAHEAALVEPSREGFFGGSAVQTFVWVPGKLYKIYLEGGKGTKLTFPPGETLAHALVLNPKSFDVVTATVGSELSAHSLILIRPCQASEPECVPAKTVDVAVTSASGRGYNLRLIVGKVGLMEAAWQITPIPYLEAPEPGTLPRRTP